MRHFRKASLRYLTSSLALAALLAACGGSAGSGAPTSGGASSAASPAATSSLPAEVQRLIAAVKSNNENEINLSWGETTIGGQEAATEIVDLINKNYGLKVGLNFTPGPSMTDIAGKITQEAAAGQKATTDVFLGSEGHFAALLKNGGLESYDYTQLSPRITKDIVVTQNIGVEIASRFPGITYNTNLIKPDQAPKKLTDLLDPKWKGKIAGEPNAASLDRVAYRPEWTPDKMKDFVKQYSQNLGELIRCEELNRVSSGEFEMFGMDCGSYEVLRQRAKGAPLGHVVPEDAALSVFFFLGVPKTSAHPNLAKLYINMVLSEQGQQILYKTSLADLHSLPGSQSAAELKELQAKGIKPLPIDPQFIIDHPEDVQLRDDLTKLVRQKS